MGIRNDPMCNNCEEGPETATHFIHECSRYAALRNFAELFHRHELHYHIYADDKQIYDCMTVFLMSETGVHPAGCSWTLPRQSLHGLALVPTCKNYLSLTAACQSTAASLNQRQSCMILASSSTQNSRWSGMLIKLLWTASINYVVFDKFAIMPDKTSPCS